MELTQKHILRYIKNNLDYDRDTGKLTWKHRIMSRGRPSAKAGREVGTINDNGYKRVHLKVYGVFTRQYVHRLIWLIEHGSFPEGQIDHINHDRLDNAISNLRDVSAFINSKNLTRCKRNMSGYTGVNWIKDSKKWEARIMVNYKIIILGRFKDIDDAIDARHKANIKYGFHKNHGSD